NTPDQTSKPIDPSPPPAPPTILQSNGTDPSAPPLENNGLPEAPPTSGLTPPLSAGGRAVAFEVAPVNPSGDSLIRRHPPKKFKSSRTNSRPIHSPRRFWRRSKPRRRRDDRRS
ncbi:hypothetical protein Pmani_005749, partial [Petrolisthes manimaculis]